MALLVAGATVLGVAILAMQTLRPVTDIPLPRVSPDLERIIKVGREFGYTRGHLRRVLPPHATTTKVPTLDRVGVPKNMAAVAEIFHTAAAHASVASYERARAVQSMGYTRPSTKIRPRFTGHIQRKHAGKLANYPFAWYELPDERDMSVHDKIMATPTDPYPESANGPEPGRVWDDSAAVVNNIHYQWSVGGAQFRALREHVVQPHTTNAAVSAPASNVPSTRATQAMARIVRFSDQPELRQRPPRTAGQLVQGRM